MPRTLFQKIWDRHIVARRAGNVLLYVDRHLVHDGGFHAGGQLAKRGLKVRRPQNTFGTREHYVPTISRDPAAVPTPVTRRMVESYQASMKQHGIPARSRSDAPRGSAPPKPRACGLTPP